MVELLLLLELPLAAHALVFFLHHRGCDGGAVAEGSGEDKKSHKASQEWCEFSHCVHIEFVFGAGE